MEQHLTIFGPATFAEQQRGDVLRDRAEAFPEVTGSLGSGDLVVFMGGGVCYAARMADKCDTYYCSWKREPDGTCVGWEIRQPRLRAEAPSPRELMRNLGKIIDRHYDDQEAALHFDPSLREAGDPAWYADGLMEIAWNAGFTFRPSALSAYRNGRCGRCGGGMGARTDEPLVVDQISENADGASSPGSNEPPPSYGMPGSLMIVSEGFLERLTDEERETFVARPIQRSDSRSGKTFFELVPHSMTGLGAIKGSEVNGWRCDQCGIRVYSAGSAVDFGTKVVCRQALPIPRPNFFFAGSETDVNLFCTIDRWRSLAGQRGARRLTGARLAVVSSEEFDNDPLLGTLDEIADFQKLHGFKVRFRPKPRN